MKFPRAVNLLHVSFIFLLNAATCGAVRYGVPCPLNVTVVSCSPDTLYADPTNCTIFYNCTSGLLYPNFCPPGQVFSRTTGCGTTCPPFSCNDDRWRQYIVSVPSANDAATTTSQQLQKETTMASTGLVSTTVFRARETSAVVVVEGTSTALPITSTPSLLNLETTSNVRSTQPQSFATTIFSSSDTTVSPVLSTVLSQSTIQQSTDSGRTLPLTTDGQINAIKTSAISSSQPYQSLQQNTSEAAEQKTTVGFVDSSPATVVSQSQQTSHVVQVDVTSALASHQTNSSEQLQTTTKAVSTFLSQQSTAAADVVTSTLQQLNTTTQQPLEDVQTSSQKFPTGTISSSASMAAATAAQVTSQLSNVSSNGPSPVPDVQATVSVRTTAETTQQSQALSSLVSVSSVTSQTPGADNEVRTTNKAVSVPTIVEIASTTQQRISQTLTSAVPVSSVTTQTLAADNAAMITNSTPSQQLSTVKEASSTSQQQQQVVLQTSSTMYSDVHTTVASTTFTVSSTAVLSTTASAATVNQQQSSTTALDVALQSDASALLSTLSATDNVTTTAYEQTTSTTAASSWSSATANSTVALVDSTTTANGAEIYHEISPATTLSEVGMPAFTAAVGQRYALRCSFKIQFPGRPTYVQSFQWSRGQAVISAGPSVHIQSDNKPDSFGWWNSTLIFDSISQEFNGEIQCYVFYNEGIVSRAGQTVTVISPPLIVVSPISQSVNIGQTFTICCATGVGSLSMTSPCASDVPYESSYDESQTVQFSWYMNAQLVDSSTDNGVTVVVRNNRFSQLSANATNDVSITCLATNVAGNSSAVATVYAVSPTDTLCRDDFANGIQWSRTKVGTIVNRPCAGLFKGLAYRQCVGQGVWLDVNVDNCVAIGLVNIIGKLNELEQGIGIDNKTQLDNVANNLQTLTQGQELTTGNLNASITSLIRLAQLHLTFTNANASQNEVNSAVSAVDNLLNASNFQSWNRLSNSMPAGASWPSVKVLKAVEIYGDQLARLLNSQTTMLQVVGNNVLLQAMRVREGESVQVPNIIQAVSEAGINLNNRWMNSSSDRITMQSETVDFIEKELGLNGEELSLYTAYYASLNEIFPANTSSGGSSMTRLNSRIMSMSISGKHHQTFITPNITFILEHDVKINLTNLTANCAFWDETLAGGSWSTYNCSVVKSNETHTQCTCSHLTNFAILLSLSPATGFDAYILSIISTVGCSLSVAAMILTIIIYGIFWKYFKSHHAAVLINFCIAMIIANIIFLAAVDKTQDKVLCLVIAVLLHYFYLAAFFLMLAEGVEMLLYIVFVFHVRRRSETAALIFAAWFLPVVVVGISLAITRTEGYGSNITCWLNVQSGLIWAFVGPALAIVLANFIILIVVLVRIAGSQFSVSQKNEKKNRIRATIWNILVISPLLGITWVFGVLSVNQSLIAFQYIFAVANSLQGVFIFVFHAICNNKKIRGSSYSSNSGLCLNWSRSRSSTNKTSKSSRSYSASNSSSDISSRQIEISLNRPHPVDRGYTAVMDYADSRLNLPANLQTLGECEVIGFSNGHLTLRPASSATGSVSTVSTQLSGSERSVRSNSSSVKQKTLHGTSIDYTSL